MLVLLGFSGLVPSDQGGFFGLCAFHTPDECREGLYNADQALFKRVLFGRNVMSSLIVKPSLTRLYVILLGLMAASGILLAFGIELTLRNPYGIVSHADWLPYFLFGAPNWWLGVVCLVFGVTTLVAVPRMLFAFIDNQICVMDSEGVRVRTFFLRTRHIEWANLSQLAVGRFGVTLQTNRGAYGVPLFVSRTHINEILYVVMHFRPDLFNHQTRKRH